MRKIVVLAAAVVVASCLASRASAEGTAMAGEACSSSDDCYDNKACLGGRCCMMTQSSYTGSDTRYTTCTACADSTHDNPGVCIGCETGYHVITGTETNALGVESQKGLCTDKYPCASPATEYYDATYDACSSKSEAGGYCEGNGCGL